MRCKFEAGRKWVACGWYHSICACTYFIVHSCRSEWLWFACTYIGRSIMTHYHCYGLDRIGKRTTGQCARVRYIIAFNTRYLWEMYTFRLRISRCSGKWYIIRKFLNRTFAIVVLSLHMFVNSDDLLDLKPFSVVLLLSVLTSGQLFPINHLINFGTRIDQLSWRS